jgi:hypothetical protein
VEEEVMTAADRLAIRKLVDRATRAKLAAQAVHGARLYGELAVPTKLGRGAGHYNVGTVGTVAPRVNRGRGFELVEDEETIEARSIEYGVDTRGYTLPSQFERSVA